ncbi:uncharacterized protein NPIL_12261 [Nephila pilipes]|uniref:Uncharacterized protein n=1 Tax=Nephila pilipes TaxID=299642 RepID=A0A8X6TYZ4_NEPPI|nr:uncharacterized protein NPIL_12261 [Nephila pilipes]
MSSILVTENTQEGNGDGIRKSSDYTTELVGETEKEIEFKTTSNIPVGYFKDDQEAEKDLNSKTLSEEQVSANTNELENQSIENSYDKIISTFKESSSYLNSSMESPQEHLQTPVNNSEINSGPEKGGEWFEPTLSSSDGVVLLHSNLHLSNETEELNSEVRHNSTSFIISDEEQKSPEKGGELFEPTLPSLFPLNSKTGEKGNEDQTAEYEQKDLEKGGELFEPTTSNAFLSNSKAKRNGNGVQTSTESLKDITEALNTATSIRFPTIFPSYVLFRAKENNDSKVSKSNTSEKLEPINGDETFSPSENKKNHNNGISPDELITKESQYYPLFAQNTNAETLELNDSEFDTSTESKDNVPTLSETQESSITSEKIESNFSTERSKAELLQPYSLIDVISNVFKAPGYDSEVHSRFLKEQINFSDKKKPVHVFKRSLGDLPDEIEFVNSTSVNSNSSSETSIRENNTHVLQTKKTVLDEESFSSTVDDMRSHDPPPAKVTSSFIFVVSSGKSNTASKKFPLWFSAGPVQDVKLSDNYAD